MNVVNEETTLTLQCTFADGTGAAVIPSAGLYRLDDVSSDTQIVDWTAFTPSAATHDLTITDAQNAILDSTRAVEKKRLTVSITFGTDNKKATAEYVYAVRNLSKIT
ncbi:MAG: hypothetical protein CVU54_01895 [Deltaproteobacteria bacterium HGW-Deltaproteobacteria-12]|nr:MAG: hypothetical protein CVU54_01895 [Deltaproteobacteria bacterium HGW-Deltaproteobacteria-12]